MPPRKAKNQKKLGRTEKKKSIPDMAQEPDKVNPDRPEAGFPVVALGASAGGLEAFTQFLSKLPANSGIVFVLIQHLDPSHPSSLVELLAGSPPSPSGKPWKATGCSRTGLMLFLRVRPCPSATVP